MENEVQMKFLFLVRGYAGELSASGNLIKPFLEKLAESNEVHVLSLADESKLLVVNNVFNHKIKFFEKKWARFLNIRPYRKSIVNSVLEGLRKIEDLSSYDYVVAITYDEAVALLDLPFSAEKKVVFFLEKFPDYSRFPFLSFWKKHQNKKIFSKFLDFKKIFCLPVFAEYAENNFNIKSGVLQLLEHPMIINKKAEIIPVQLNDANANLNVLYAGGLDRWQRSPFEVCSLLSELKEVKGRKILYQFFSYGNVQKKLKDIYGMNKNFSINNAISKDELDGFYKNADLLLTIGNRDPAFVPSKIFDCISYCKPIIHFSFNEKDPYIRYLDKYPLSLIVNVNGGTCDITPEELGNFIEQVFDKDVDFSIIHDLYLECTPDYVVNKFISLCNE